MFKYVISAVLAISAASTQAAEEKTLVLTSDNVLVMDSEFTSSSTSAVLAEAQRLDSKLQSGDPLILVIYSPGGSIQAGLELADGLKALNRPVHTLTMFAASMGFQTVQALGTRYITHYGTLMTHKASGGFEGEFPGQIDSRYEYWLRRLAELDRHVVARSKGKLTAESYRALYENEYWVDGFGAVDKGLADEVVKVKCDHSLSGTKEQNFDFLGLTITLVLSKCPTITGPLDVIVNVHTNQGVMKLADFLKKGGSLKRPEETYTGWSEPNSANKTQAPVLNVPEVTMDQINAAVEKARSTRNIRSKNVLKGIP